MLAISKYSYTKYLLTMNRTLLVLNIVESKLQSIKAETRIDFFKKLSALRILKGLKWFGLG